MSYTDPNAEHIYDVYEQNASKGRTKREEEELLAPNMYSHPRKGEVNGIKWSQLLHHGLEQPDAGTANHSHSYKLESLNERTSE